MAAYLREHPRVGLVYADCQVVDANDAPLRISRRPPPALIDEKNVVGACFLYRRSVAAVVGEYDPATFLAEDYDYWLRISKVAPLGHLSGVTPYRFREHGASLSSLRGVEALLQAARVRAKYVHTERERQALMADGHCAAATLLRWNGEYRDALRHCLRAIRLDASEAAAYRALILTWGAMLCRPSRHVTPRIGPKERAEQSRNLVRPTDGADGAVLSTTLQE
jgi:hypothetical protein